MKHSARIVVREDYFGELALFQDKQHAYSARAMTHLDTYHLSRGDFETVVCDHPSSAVQISDIIPRVLPHGAAKVAIDRI